MDSMRGRESGGGFGSSTPPVEETVINDSQQAGGFGEHSERQASYDEDRPESHAELEDASYQPNTDPTSFDDLQTDNSDSDFGGGDDSNLS
jgi:uncharacterized protein